MTQYKIGVELEVPFTPENQPKGKSKGVPSDVTVTDNELHRPSAGGEITNELISTKPAREYGLEIRTPDGGIDLSAIRRWYRRAWNEVEDRFGREIEPTGFFGDGTAGLHVHLSPLNESQADSLFELSKDPYVQVFCSSSVAGFTPDEGKKRDIPVVRPGGHCQLPDKRRNNHDCCVNKHRSGGEGHYEWRLPEPMPPEHFDKLKHFLVAFLEIGPRKARNYAEREVKDGSDTITAIRRARNVADDFDGRLDPRNEAGQILSEVI
jgi:hypothetical protein